MTEKRHCRECGHEMSRNSLYDLCPTHNMLRLNKAGVGARARHRRYRQVLKENEQLRQQLAEARQGG